MRTFRTVWTKLQQNGAAYRKAFVASELKRLIPFQIYALRKKRGWSQEELAKRSGLTQGVISRAEDPDYGNLTFNTVINITGGFDVAFVGKFVPFSELDDYFVGLSEESAGSVPAFDEENARIEQLIEERERKLEREKKATAQDERKEANVTSIRDLQKGSQGSDIQKESTLPLSLLIAKPQGQEGRVCNFLR